MRSCLPADFGPDRLDALAELVNIAFGRAMSPLSELLGAFVRLEVPDVQCVVALDVADRLGTICPPERPVHVVRQAFRPTLRGEGVMVLDLDEASLRRVLGVGDDDAETRDAVLEIANIVLGACIGRLADLLATEVAYAPPHLALFREPLHTLPAPDMDDLTICLLIRTGFRVDEVRWQGTLFLMLPVPVVAWLADALDAFVSRHAG